MADFLETSLLTEFELAEAQAMIKQAIEDNFADEHKVGAEFEPAKDAEIAFQLKRLASYTSGEESVDEILVGKINGQVVATIGFGQATEPVKAALEKLGKTSEGLVEIIALYVKVDQQGKGIGSQMLTAILEDLKEIEAYAFSTSTGYKKGVNFWKKKLGEPTTILEKFYNGRTDCYVWIKTTSEVSL